MITAEQIKEWIREVNDPELNLSIVDLGLVYSAAIDESGKVTVEMTLTSPGCPVGPQILEQVYYRLKQHPEVKDASVKLVWEPKWDPKLMASDEVKDKLGIW